MSNSALGGLAATRDAVVMCDRDPADRVDIFRCLNADGSERWTVRYPAPGELDYGNSSRATPLIEGDSVFLAGARGHLHAVDLKTGTIRWKKQFQKDFGGPEKLSWGFCSSPLLADGKLIVQPGGRQAAIVALDPATGDVIWKTPGRPPGHSSPVLAVFGGRQQIIGYDDESLGGWELATGKRLWTLKPPRPGDFNVPTPIARGDKVIVATENNGARMYRINEEGVVDDEPIASNDRLLPDCQSPILVGERLYGVAAGLFCLDASRKLSEVWHRDDEPFNEYASLIASPQRILVTSLHGKLFLLNATGDRFEKLSELELLEEEAGLYSHPAIVGSRLYVRGSKELVCFDLGAVQRE
jgi:outer membrane protein assembly factor BamB